MLFTEKEIEDYNTIIKNINIEKLIDDMTEDELFYTAIHYRDNSILCFNYLNKLINNNSPKYYLISCEKLVKNFNPHKKYIDILLSIDKYNIDALNALYKYYIDIGDETLALKTIHILARLGDKNILQSVVCGMYLDKIKVSIPFNNKSIVIVNNKELAITYCFLSDKLGHSYVNDYLSLYYYEEFEDYKKSSDYLLSYFENEKMSDWSVIANLINPKSTIKNEEEILQNLKEFMITRLPKLIPLIHKELDNPKTIYKNARNKFLSMFDELNWTNF